MLAAYPASADARNRNIIAPSLAVCLGRAQAKYRLQGYLCIKALSHVPIGIHKSFTRGSPLAWRCRVCKSSAARGMVRNQLGRGEYEKENEVCVSQSEACIEPRGQLRTSQWFLPDEICFDTCGRVTASARDRVRVVGSSAALGNLGGSIPKRQLQ